MNEPQRIRALRLHNQMTLQALAEKTGTTKSQIDKLEKGERRLTIEWLKKIAEALNVSPAVFLLDNFSLEQPPQQQFRLQELADAYGHDDDISYGMAGHQTTTLIPPLPIRGMVDPLTGHLTNIDTITSQVPCPPALQSVTDAYAVYTPDESLAPRLHMGELAYIHPSKPIVPGCYVLLSKRNSDAVLRRFVERQDEDIIVTAYTRDNDTSSDTNSNDTGLNNIGLNNTDSNNTEPNSTGFSARAEWHGIADLTSVHRVMGVWEG